MVMPASVMEARPIGRHEVRITRVYTVEAGEFATKHDRTPNWSENNAPIPGTSTFELRIEAEAGEHIVTADPTYIVEAKAMCLTNPLATIPLPPFLNPDNLHVTLPAVKFSDDGWEYDSVGERYTKTWSIGVPVAPDPLVAAPGLLQQVNQIYQFFVTLIDTAGTKVVGCTAVSEPFMLL